MLVGTLPASLYPSLSLFPDSVAGDETVPLCASTVGSPSDSSPRPQHGPSKTSHVHGKSSSSSSSSAYSFLILFSFSWGRKNGWPVTESQAQLVRTALRIKHLAITRAGREGWEKHEALKPKGTASPAADSHPVNIPVCALAGSLSNRNASGVPIDFGAGGLRIRRHSEAETRGGYGNGAEAIHCRNWYTNYVRPATQLVAMSGTASIGGIPSQVLFST